MSMVFKNNIDDPEITGYIKKLMMMAMGFFVLTVLIGLINVFDRWDHLLSRGLILFHVHAGTIAWISTGIVSALIWAFSQGREITEEYKSKITKFYKFWQVVIPTYALVILISFQIQFFLLLPVLGLLTVVGFFWATYIAYTEMNNIPNFGVPHLSFVIGLFFAGYAGFIGTLIGLQHVIGQIFIPGDSIGAHAGGMEIGYVFVTVTGLIELFLKGDNTEKLTKFGASQPIILAISAFLASLGLFFDVGILVQLYLPFELIGVIIFFIRMGPEFIKTEHLNDPIARYFVVAPIFLIATVSIFMYVLIVFFIPQNLTDPYAFELIKALNHSELIGATSGPLFGMLTAFTLDQRQQVMPWADLVGFSLLYLGLVGFVLGFIFQFALHSAIIMGIGILILIGTFFARLTK